MSTESNEAIFEYFVYEMCKIRGPNQSLALV
jgi:hypothetical protein